MLQVIYCRFWTNSLSLGLNSAMGPADRTRQDPDSLSCSRRHDHAVKQFASFLAEQGLAPDFTAIQPKEPKLKSFSRWLEQHRGIQARTIGRYDREVSSLLVDLGTDRSRYDAASVRQVLLDRFAGVSVTHAKSLA